MRNRFAAAVVLVGLLALRANAQDAERLPVPEAEAVAAEVRIVQQAFEGEYADAANGDATKLISTLLGAERKAKSAERRYALWAEAERAAGLAGNVSLCLDIIRRKGTAFEIDVIRAQIERLKDLQDGDHGLDANVYPEANRLASEAYSAGMFAVSEAAVAVAKAAARQARPSKEDVRRLEELTGLIAATQIVTADGAKGRIALDADPNDRHAMGQVGLEELLVQRDVGVGLALLAKSDLEKVGSAAKAERSLADSENRTATQVYEVASLWWDAADEVPGTAVLIRRHAGGLYAQVAGNLPDPVDAALASRRAASVPVSPPPDSALPDDVEGDDEADESHAPITFKGPAKVYGGRFDPETRRRLVEEGGGSVDTEKAVDAALRWIAGHQLDDGSWSFNLKACPSCKGQCAEGRSAGAVEDYCGATALALLPFLARGETHKSGPYAKKIRAGLVFLGKAIESGKGKAYSRGGNLYSQGLATMVLTESYLLTRDPRLKRHTTLAVDFVVAAQDPVGGGWRYSPKQPGDTSATGWQIAALANAKAARISVNPLTFKKASAFLDSVQSDDGRAYGYTDSKSPGPARNAIGLLCRLELGAAFKSDAQRDALKNLIRGGPSNDLYHDFYATQVLYRAEAEGWRQWNDAMVSMLLDTQSKKGHEAGSWFDGVSGGHGADAAGRLYTTSMAALILEVYYRILPRE
ncbi:MAG: hypothetical protein NT171_09200 [Planctomycetota bacterium]|nr:hypothetical protein [Planctomycetota bacterium]